MFASIAFFKAARHTCEEHFVAAVDALRAMLCAISFSFVFPCSLDVLVLVLVRRGSIYTSRSVFFLAFWKSVDKFEFLHLPHPPSHTKKETNASRDQFDGARDALIEERDICIYKDRILITFDVPFSLRKQCFWCRTDRYKSSHNIKLGIKKNATKFKQRRHHLHHRRQ